MKELIVDATEENFGTVIDFVMEQIKATDCSSKIQKQIEMVVEELYVNIVSYAYVPQTGSATIRTDITSDKAEITFIDSGMQYDPLAKPDPDMTIPVWKRQVGGLGIFMVKKSMDDVRYEYKDGENILTIVKKLG